MPHTHCVACGTTHHPGQAFRHVCLSSHPVAPSELAKVQISEAAEWDDLHQVIRSRRTAHATANQWG